MARILHGRRLRTINGKTKTIDEWFSGQRPILSDLHVFGCISYAWIPKVLRQKFQKIYDTSVPLHVRPCFYLGPENRAHRLFDPITNTIFQGSTILFAEKTFGWETLRHACEQLGINTNQPTTYFTTHNIPSQEDPEKYTSHIPKFPEDHSYPMLPPPDPNLLPHEIDNETPILPPPLISTPQNIPQQPGPSCNINPTPPHTPSPGPSHSTTPTPRPTTPSQPTPHSPPPLSIPSPTPTLPKTKTMRNPRQPTPTHTEESPVAHRTRNTSQQKGKEKESTNPQPTTSPPIFQPQPITLESMFPDPNTNPILLFPDAFADEPPSPHEEQTLSPSTHTNPTARYSCPLPPNTGATTRKPRKQPLKQLITNHALSALTLIERMTPKSYNVAITGPEKDQWIASMRKEIEVFQKYDTYELVPPNEPNTCGVESYVIRSLWKYRIKTQNGIIQRYKSRLCADRAQMKEQVRNKKLSLEDDLHLTHDKITSPSPEMSSTRLFLALAARLNLTVHSGDIPSAYLQAPIDQSKFRVYMHQPKGFVDPDRPNWLWRLKSAVYGCINAGHIWNGVYAGELDLLGFKPSPHDPCIFILQKDGETMYFKLNTDDNLNMATCEKLRKSVIDHLTKRFGYTDEGICNHHLGMSIHQGTDAISINQNATILSILDEFSDLAKCNVPAQNFTDEDTPKHGGATDEETSLVNDSPSPLTHSSPPTQPKPSKLVQRHGPIVNKKIREPGMFRSILGKLRYITNTRPDIEFALNYICRFQSCPEDAHYTRLLDLLGYLLRFPDLSLSYPICKDGSASLSLSAKVDESYADCKLTRRTTFGFIIYLDGCPIMWKSRRTPFVTSGTASTAFVAMNFATREALFSKHVMSFLNHTPPSPIKIFSDNNPAVLAVNTKNCTKLSKHLDAQYHFVREQQALGHIRALWFPRSENESDILSRPVEAVAFTKLRSLLLH